MMVENDRRSNEGGVSWLEACGMSSRHCSADTDDRVMSGIADRRFITSYPERLS